MKLFLFTALALFALGKKSCNHTKMPAGYYKGRLEVKGACMNYTIKLLEGKMDTTLYNKEWKDEHSGKSYTNVFALRSRCHFPSEIKEGEEFYFTIDSNYVQRCMVCLIFYPTPPKSISIKVISPEKKSKF
ncbi:MAG: hypothetical protein ACJ748_15025 [Flavisolibacter sp.]